MRKCPWLVFALIFCWKLALFLISAQPIPANDSFFYDGAAIHKLLYGGFYNPTLAQAFPICSKQIFSAYPPLYQVPLLGWMSVFGTSARSVMGLHLALFGGYLLVLAAIFRRLKTPAWCVNLAGGFLLLMTFHDRPDSLAHLLGMLGVYGLIRSRIILGGDKPPASGNNPWAWSMVTFAFLSLSTSLQIGTIYIMIILVGTAAACSFGKEKFPWSPFVTLFLTPIALVLMLKIMFPLAWAGFLEHARQTPTLTGLRFPRFPELLKIGRAVPGIILVLILLPLSWFKQHHDFDSSPGRRHELILIPTFVGALGVTVAAMFILTANTVGIAVYLQPLLVAAYLTICSTLFSGERWLRLQVTCVSAAILLGSVRAIGMSTWGLACAADIGYSAANEKIDSELAKHGEHCSVVMSSAFLYGAVKHKDINFIHSDWLDSAGGDSQASDLRGLLKLKPEKIILTQFDYYRRFEGMLKNAKDRPEIREIKIVNTARTRAPDSYRSLQQVVQHISWAPVFVNLTWRD